MAARLERDIQRATLSLFPSFSEGKHFRVRLAGALMITLPDDATSGDNNGADHRVRAGTPSPLCRKTERSFHVDAILIGGIHRVLRDAALPCAARAEREPFLKRAGPFAFAVFFLRLGATETFGDFFFPTGIPLMAACAAANLAIGTRNGEQLT